MYITYKVNTNFPKIEAAESVFLKKDRGMDISCPATLAPEERGPTLVGRIAGQDISIPTSKSFVWTDEFARPYTDWNDIASKDRLSRRQQVICAANDVDGENGRCPDASHSSLQVFNRLDVRFR